MSVQKIRPAVLAITFCSDESVPFVFKDIVEINLKSGDGDVLFLENKDTEQFWIPWRNILCAKISYQSPAENNEKRGEG